MTFQFFISGLIRTVFQNLSKVKHYRIRKRDNNQGYFISNRVIFDDMVKLVAHYRNSADGLCCQLKEACRLQEMLQNFFTGC